MRYELSQQQLVELGQLELTVQKMRRAEKKCRKRPLYTGAIQQLVETLNGSADARGCSATCGMANNHGLSSDELDSHEAAVLAAAASESSARRYLEDRRDSDSQDVGDGPSSCQGRSDPPHQQHRSVEMRRAVKCQHRYRQLQLCQTRQHQRQLIIPKRLQVDSKSVQPQISIGGGGCVRQYCTDCENQEEDERASADLDEMIFPPTATVTGSGHDDSDVDDGMEAGARCNRMQPARQMSADAHRSLPSNHQRYEQPAQCLHPSVITDEDGRSDNEQPSNSSHDSLYRQEFSVELSPYALPPPPLPRLPPQPPVSLTIDRQVVRLTSGFHKRRHHRHSRRPASRKGEVEIDEANEDDGANVATLLCQLRQIEHCQRHRESAALGALGAQGQMLCTSSSNCCTRKGSVRGRGSSGGYSPEGSPESSLNLVAGTTILSRPGSLAGINIDGLVSRRLRCAHETFKEDEEPSAWMLGDLQQSRGSKKTVSFSTNDPVQHRSSEGPTDSTAAASEAEFSELDSERMEFEMSKRGSISADGVASTVEMPATPILRLQPVRRKKSEVMENLSSCRQSAANESMADDSNIEMAVGWVTVSENVGSGQKIASRFRLAADSEMPEAASTENEQQGQQKQQEQQEQQPEIPEKQEEDLLPSDPFSDTAGLELINESNTNLTAQQRNNALQSTTLPTATRSQQSRHHHSRRKQLAAVYDNMRQTLTRLDSQCSARRCRGRRDPVSEAPQPVPLRHTSGSNCANSSTALRHSQQRRERRRQLQQCSASSIGYGTWTEQRTGEAARGEDSSSVPTMTSATRNAPPTTATAEATVGCQASYVVFQHPPEVATAKQAAMVGKIGCSSYDVTSGSYCPSSLEGDCCFCSDESLAFSWVSSLGNESNAVDLSLSLDEGSFNETSVARTSSRHRRHKRKSNLPSGEVTFHQLSTAEDCLYKLSPVVPVCANIMAGDLNMTVLEKPSAVRDFAARSSIAKKIFQPMSSDASCTQEEEEEEGRRVAHEDDRTDSGSASDQPFLMLEALSCGHEGLNCFGCYHRHQPVVASQAKWQQHCPQSPQLPPHVPPPESSQSRSSMCGMASTLSSSPPAVDVEAGALRNLLATVFHDPSESCALTVALMRGLLCNVESLRSTLGAALLLLKNRRGCSGPLTQAIGTANVLDDLIRQLQDSQRSRSRNRNLRRRRLKQHQQQQQRLFSAEVDCTTVDDEERSSSASVADAIQRCLHRGRPVEHRCLPAIPIGTVQCHAMSHYVIGEQFVEPSLEQRSSLECRPVTTRVILPEATKSVSQPRGSRFMRR